MKYFSLDVKFVATPRAFVLVLLLLGGCRGPWPGGLAQHAESIPVDAGSSDAMSTDSGIGSLANQQALVKSDDNPAFETQEAAMVAVLDQLQEIEAIDPAAKQQLLSDLKAAKPENWPLIVEQFQSALAYRQQLAAKKEPELQPSDTDLAKKENVPQPQPVAHPEPSQAVATATDMHPAVAVDRTPPKPTATSPVRQTPVFAPTENPSEMRQVNFESKEQLATTWDGHLQQAIFELEKTLQNPPGSTEEVQQHLRLRLLQQLAGQDEQALSPIAGASPSMQDYWSKQMFTIATFLDSQRQPDDKRRAAGSLVHLDQARAKLSELAKLQIRNLTFVDSVDGYGVYQQREATQFQPGQQVSMYCEIENFQCISTKTGYQTLLATSYEVVDLNGQRVDGRDFPEVEDFCQNVRRDFHMQYGIDLPTRIYPGKYELKLVVTDRHSHKIGQASVPFEIVE